LSVVRGRGWLFVLVTSVCLAISALYELLEWTVSVLTGSAGGAFFGAQGDVFDTQKDMGMALCGGILAQLLLSPYHDGQIRRMGIEGGRGECATRRRGEEGRHNGSALRDWKRRTVRSRVSTSLLFASLLFASALPPYPIPSFVIVASY